MTTDNVKPKGGRGKRAEYQTIQVRCPEPVKPEVMALINHWHATGETTQSQHDTEINQLQAEISRLNQLNINSNTTIEELKKQNEQLDSENLKLHERTGNLTLIIDTLKSELTQYKQKSN
jgi:chromosome segregation ATPase